MKAAAAGDRVSLRLEGRTEDGKVFDRTPDGTTHDTVLGTGNLLPVIEMAVVGMKAGEKKTLPVTPSQGFGERLEELVFRLPRDQIPADAEVGAALKVKFEGQEGLVTVVAFEKDLVVLDANHPLAGHSLEMRIEVVSVVEA